MLKMQEGNKKWAAAELHIVKAKGVLRFNRGDDLQCNRGGVPSQREALPLARRLLRRPSFVTRRQ
jgi:hypothetical protein